METVAQGQLFRSRWSRAEATLRLTEVGAVQKPTTAHHYRVKTALARKEAAVNSLRKQHEVGPSGGL